MKRLAFGLLVFGVVGAYCVCGAVLAAEDLEEGLALYLPLNDDGGEEAMDASGNENNGILKGCKWTDEGKFKGALHFSADASMTIPSSESLLIQEGITLSLWFFYEEKGAVEQRGIFCPESWNLDLVNSGGRVEIHNNGAYHGCVNSKPPSAGQWYLITGTYDQSAMRFYLNGEKTADCPLAGKIDGSGSPITVGNTGWGPAMIGIYDEIRIYNRALTDKEVKALYEYEPGELAVSPGLSLIATWAEIKDEH